MHINIDAFNELEDIILSSFSTDRETIGASIAIDILGVIGDIKPATNAVLDVEIGNFVSHLHDLGLRLSYIEKDIKKQDGSTERKAEYFISKDAIRCEQLYYVMHLASSQNSGTSFKDVGRLVGFPETAINYYEQRMAGKVDATADAERVARYSHFIHSEHEVEEFEQYDKPLHELAEKYCPRSAWILKEYYQQRSMRWL